MKILIAAASFSSNISGLQRHAFNVARCLLQQSEISAVHFVIAPWQRNLVEDTDLKSDLRFSVHVADMNRSSLSRNLWYYRQLPRLAAQLETDLVHLSYPMPVNSSRFTCPTVVTLHDLYPYEIPRNFGLSKFMFNRLILQQCLRSADAIACVSEATTTRLRKHVSAAVQRKAVRIYNCVEAAQVCAIQSPIPRWKGESFLLCIAQHRRNKNIPLLIRAFDRLLRSGQIGSEMKLVIIGIAGPETRKIHQLISSRVLGQSIHLLEGKSEAELQWCYARCEALVAPSITEGFGLPVAEALLAGCRVICSDIPAHREVGDGRCRFVVLQKEPEVTLATAIIEALREPQKPPMLASPTFRSGSSETVFRPLPKTHRVRRTRAWPFPAQSK